MGPHSYSYVANLLFDLDNPIVISLNLQIFPIHEKIENINDQYWTLRAEEVNSISKALSH